MINRLSTALSTLGRLLPLGTPENTGQRYRLEVERNAALRTDVVVVSSRFDHSGTRPEVYAKEEVPDIISEDSDERDAMVLAAAMRLLVAVAGTVALVKAGVIQWTGAAIDARDVPPMPATVAPIMWAGDRTLAGAGPCLPVSRVANLQPDGTPVHTFEPSTETTRTTLNDLMNGSAIRAYYLPDVFAPDSTTTVAPTIQQCQAAMAELFPDSHATEAAASAAWSASLRAKLAASETLHGDYDDD